MQKTLSNNISSFIQKAKQVHQLTEIIERRRVALSLDEDLYLPLSGEEAAEFLGLTHLEFITKLASMPTRHKNRSVFFRKTDLYKHLLKERETLLKHLLQMIRTEQALCSNTIPAKMRLSDLRQMVTNEKGGEACKH